jgi:type IV secretion system protein VirD4
MSIPAPYTPYCGLLYRDGNPYMAESAPHLAISAPTRTGKTRRILAPAAVVPADPATADSLITHVRSRIAGFKVPRRVEFVASLPRSAAGKLVKGDLRQQFSSPERTSL